jgi:hypothetical protein
MIYKVLAFCITAFGFAGCAIFLVNYVLRTRGAWRDSEPGRFLVVVYTNLAALFLVVMVNQVFGDWLGRQVVTLGLYLAYVLQTWWPLRLLRIAQERESIGSGKHRREGDD